MLQHLEQNKYFQSTSPSLNDAEMGASCNAIIFPIGAINTCVFLHSQQKIQFPPARPILLTNPLAPKLEAITRS